MHEVLNRVFSPSLLEDAIRTCQELMPAAAVFDSDRFSLPPFPLLLSAERRCEANSRCRKATFPLPDKYISDFHPLL